MAQSHGPTGGGAEPGSADPLHPQFIIASNGKYYLTTGVWEYDPNKPGLSDAQRLGVEAISDHFSRLRREGWERAAVQTTETPAAFLSFQHTIGPGPPPGGV